MADGIRATPRQNQILGLLADRLKQAQQFGAKPFGYENPPAEMLMNLLGVPAVQQTLERMSYGEPLTTGKGMTTQVRPEAVEAAMTLLPMSAGAAKATKNLPVGASIKDVSEIVAKYPDVKLNLFEGKNNINLSRIVVPKEMRNQGVGKSVMEDVTQYADSVGKQVALTPSSDFGGNVNRLKTFYKDFGFVENKGKNKDFAISESMYREPKPVQQSAQFEYPQEEALRLAQQRAALPVEQGGLGLPVGNTPMDRAKAMGFDIPAFHATDVDFESIKPSAKGKLGAGVYVSPSAKYAEKYAGDEARVLPLLTRGNLASDDIAMDIADKTRQEMYSKNPNFSVQEWKQRTTQELLDAGYDGRDMSGLESVIFNPENIRSRFAAFDPFRKTAAIAATMGVAAPNLMAQEVDYTLLPAEKKQELLRSLLGQ